MISWIFVNPVKIYWMPEDLIVLCQFSFCIEIKTSVLVLHWSVSIIQNHVADDMYMTRQ